MFKKVLRGAAIALIVIISIIVIKDLPFEEIREMVETGGKYGAGAYIALFALLPAFFFPIPAMEFLGGLGFGLLKGSLYAFVGIILNCSLMFTVSRFIAGDKITEIIKEKVPEDKRDYIIERLKKESFIGIFLLRLIPMIPFSLVSYLSGLTSVDFKTYLIASTAGMLPGAIVFVNIGDKASQGEILGIAGSFLIMILLGGAALYFGYLYRKHEKKKENETAEEK